MRVVEGLWGGELPVFDDMAEAQKLVSTLLEGFWNDLARHQKRAHPFHLTRLAMEATASNLRNFGQVRLEELDGFVEGLFAGQEEIDLPERAHGAVRRLLVMVEDTLRCSILRSIRSVLVVCKDGVNLAATKPWFRGLSLVHMDQIVIAPGITSSSATGMS